ncbi:transporter substrate-binding domain-containing protein [Microbulbifer halophilus]|uniref:Transporter substrate-binding domain-containing protein n=1 Tax=Microbulbifer halophilus TaxID=453963 RepID=A0ABW5E957_9GAMM|nr:transporter substrate-binding domain-containing protein [Microbulbifer halophilus]MCW8126428.1 transporter substrate-binding domain-containing protein [Microbulbifer halophilus]
MPNNGRWYRFGPLLLLMLVAGSFARAQEASEPAPRQMDVGLYISPPFVMEEDGDYRGLALDLWREVAAEQNLQSNYRTFDTLGDLVEATASGDIDVAVTNLTITEGRAERIDFTQPWFDAGLRIMVDKSQGGGFLAVFRGLRDSGHLEGYLWLISIILLFTLLFTLFDRRFDSEFPRRWREGLAESFYSVMSIATSGQMMRKNLFGWIGRIWEGLWLVCGVAVVSYITASVTSVMTSISLTSQINGLRDLPGKTVGVFSGSVAEEFVQQQGIASRGFKDIDEAVQALSDGRVEAIVGDAPVLAYYAHTHPELPLLMVGKIFQPDKYGFGLARHSELRRPISVDIIGARESGRIRELREKYFGQPR